MSSESKPASSRNKVISCAECRRLKLRCDRQFPCHNCTKRGLSSICPQGALPTRPKMLLEEADRLNKRNVELTERIRLLEEGLASIQAGISDEIHPLLARTSPDGADDLSESANVQREVDEVNDSLGTLTIGKDGRSLFLGNTAGIETLFRSEPQDTGQSEWFTGAEPFRIYPNILHSLGIFSSLPDGREIVLENLQQFLPSSTVALSLVGVYFNHGAWLYNPISKSKFFEEVYNPVYASGSGRIDLSIITPHNAALLFIVFALGSFLSKDNDADVTEHYHQLARTAMSCDAILVDPTMPAIRTLMLMAFYHLLRDKNGSQNCWALMGLATHMAQNIGLRMFSSNKLATLHDLLSNLSDRDSWRWKLDDAIVQERRTLFWELYWLGINQCLSFGRPPSLLLAYCDCEIPRKEERLENRPGEIKPGFHLRKYQFASEVLSQVVEAVLGVKRTPYSTILALDRKVRDHQSLKVPPNGATGPAELGAATVTLTLQRFMLKAAVEMILLYLHRRYFARALCDYPSDILGCRFGPSVLATYRSACIYISLMRSLCTLQPELPTKFVVFWNHLLASSIVVGSVAIKCPRCVLAPSAISELERCFILFENAARFRDSSARPARGLAIVSRLRDRAHQLAAALTAGVLPEEPVRGTKGLNPDHETDELLILSGRGRLVEAKPLSRSPQDSPVRPSSITNAGTAYYSPHNSDLYNVAHPMLLNNLRVATQQQTAPQSAEMIFNDATMWEGTGIYDLQASPGVAFQSSNVDQDTGNPAQPWYPTPSPPQEGPEEQSHGGPGTAMSWESNWQGYMQQLGVPYDNDLGF